MKTFEEMLVEAMEANAIKKRFDSYSTSQLRELFDAIADEINRREEEVRKALINDFEKAYNALCSANISVFVDDGLVDYWSQFDFV